MAPSTEAGGGGVRFGFSEIVSESHSAASAEIGDRKVVVKPKFLPLICSTK